MAYIFCYWQQMYRVLAKLHKSGTMVVTKISRRADLRKISQKNNTFGGKLDILSLKKRRGDILVKILDLCIVAAIILYSLHVLESDPIPKTSSDLIFSN